MRTSESRTTSNSMMLQPLLNPKFAIKLASLCARTSGSGALVESRSDLRDALGKDILRDFILDRAGEDLLGRRDSSIGSGSADVRERLRLRLGNLALGHFGVSGDELLDLGFGFACEPVGLGLGARQD